MGTLPPSREGGGGQTRAPFFSTAETILEGSKQKSTALPTRRPCPIFSAVDSDPRGRYGTRDASNFACCWLSQRVTRRLWLVCISCVCGNIASESCWLLTMVRAVKFDVRPQPAACDGTGQFVFFFMRGGAI